MVNVARRRAVPAAIAALALATALLVPATVLADVGGGIDPRRSDRATVDVVGATFNNKLMATIHFVVVCDPLTYFDWNTGEEVTTTSAALFANGQLLQAQGRSIAAAGGYAGWAGVTCDGSTLNDGSVQVIAQELPLKRGDALVGVSVELSASEFGWSGGSSGPTSVRLGR